MTAVLRIAFVLATFVLAATTRAQAVLRPGASTAGGEVPGSSAETICAEAEAARAWSHGYDFHMPDERRGMLVGGQHYQMRRQAALDRIEVQKRIVEDRRRRRAEDAARADAAARALVAEVQLGIYAWPEALRRNEYQDSMRMVESILVDWGRGEGGTDAVGRRALATEVAVLRKRVATNRAIPFESRRQAVASLKLLQRAAKLEASLQFDAVAWASDR